jgi:hypothetical protein
MMVMLTNEGMIIVTVPPTGQHTSRNNDSGVEVTDRARVKQALEEGFRKLLAKLR